MKMLIKLGGALCGLVAMAATAAVWAQSLADPTRPPASLGNAAADSSAEASSLQSIIRSSRGKPAAIINGEYVVLGGRVGEARLVKIGEDSVTLKGPAGMETLMLIPGVEKKTVNEFDSATEAKKMHKNGQEVKR